MCGENNPSSADAKSAAGSPPRVRGKLSTAAPGTPDTRITPACAGKTHIAISALLDSWDHPRVCGENASLACPFSLSEGSPPRVRGKPPPVTPYRAGDGITPACAGKTHSRRSATSSSRDHPRVCGENCTNRATVSICQGSPPRVRGKLILCVATATISRITPACAGKTSVMRDRVSGT